MAKYTNYNHFTENDVVDIRGLSEEQVKKILELNPKNDCPFNVAPKEGYYRPLGNNGLGVYVFLNPTKYNNYTIHPASDFLDEEWIPKWGEEIEGSDDAINWNKELFVGMNPEETDYKYVCANGNWKHVRPYINPCIAEIKAQIEALQNELKELEK